MLSVRALCKSFRRGAATSPHRTAALAGVSLDVRESECVGIVGPHGSGKTTLLQCAAGLLRPDSGEVYWYGERFAGGGVVPGLAFVPSAPLYYQCLTVADVLEYRAARERSLMVGHLEFRNIMSLLGLSAVLHQSVLALSRPLVRRLALAEAMIGGPDVVFLDTGARGDDPENDGVLTGALRHIAASGVTLVLAARAIDNLAGAVTRLLTIDGGVVLESRAEPALETARPESSTTSNRRFVAERIH
ncbi:MAG: ATP-binding cassette domain-containing protein [Gemmatimonadota bacterium]|nr:ATP-binding cassette domain-containing protein [Gemmatimonadota bacterium]